MRLFEHSREVSPWLYRITLPDPPESWLEAIRWFDFVRGELVKIAVTEPVVALAMAGAIAATFGIQPQSVLAAEGG